MIARGGRPARCHLWGILMQVTETLNEGLKRGYNIVVSAAELDEKVNEKLVEAQPEIEMKGFRKGKVPMPLLRKQFGERLLGEAMQEAIDGAMTRHFEESGEKPALQPKVEMKNGEEWKPGADVEVEMSYEALPDIPDVDFSKITLEKMVVEADDAAIDEALANLAENAQNFKPRKKGSKAKDGDQVTFDFVGTVDGEAFDGVGRRGRSPPGGTRLMSIELDTLEQRIIGGSTAEIVDTLATLRADIGVPVEWVARSYFPDVPYQRQVEIADALASEVMPFLPTG